MHYRVFNVMNYHITHTHYSPLAYLEPSDGIRHMIRRKRTEIRKVFTSAVIAGFFSLSIFGSICLGMASNASMAAIVPMNAMDMPAVGCMTAQGNICLMNFSEHLTQWQSAFQGSVKSIDYLLAVVVVLLGITLSFFRRKMLESLWRQRLRFQLFLCSVLQPSLRILKAFSRGILHSQIYA